MFFYRNALLVSAAVIAVGMNGAMAPCAWGQTSASGTAEPAGDTITVVATGSQLPINQTGQSVSVIDQSEIEAVQGPDLTRVLERLPGVSIAREGGIGSQTSLFVRGANSQQLVVLIDGVRVDDVTQLNGGFDLGTMLSGNIGKIELLRGSNSVVWGSEAIGGVLAITTAETNGAEASVEHGAYDSTYATAVAGIKRDAYAASISAAYDYSAGFPALTGAPRDDGFTQWQVTGKGRAELADGLSLKVTGRYADGRLDFEGFGSPAEQWTKQTSGRVGLDWTTGALKLSGGVSLSDTSRYYDYSAFGGFTSEYLGLTERAEVTGRLTLPSHFALDFGGEGEWDRAVTTYDDRQADHLASGHALLGWYTDAVSLSGGVRVDTRTQFGTHVTTGANGSVRLAGDWRLRASYGEGFRAPSLYNLYDPYSGNLNLKAETSRSYEGGIEKGDRNARQHFALTYFRRDSRNLIDTDSNFVYLNIPGARATGVELEMGERITDNFRVSADFTHVKSVNTTTGVDLARRPRDTVHVSADWQTPLRIARSGGLTLGADLTMVSNALDYYPGGPPAVAVPAYVVGGVRASLPVCDKVELIGRIENIGDAHYYTATDSSTVHYNQPGRSAYLGVRARL